ncbi:MAG: molybdopterin-dependent oxidoreductase [Acidimicrobiales bacterium]
MNPEPPNPTDGAATDEESMMAVGPPESDPARITAGALAGLVAGLVGLSVGHLTAGLAPSLRSPLVSVGDRVVDNAPAWLKDLGIELFGTNDKAALIIGTALLLSAVAAAAGMLAMRGRRWWAMGLVAAFAGVGMAAGGLGRNSTGAGWVPSAAAGVATAVALWWLSQWWLAGRKSQPMPSVPSMPGVMWGRRRFLLGATTLTVAAAGMGALGQALRQRFSADLERARVRLAGPTEPLPDPPADPAATVAGLSPLFVANKDFYRIDTALLTPVVTAANWALNIDGMVQRPLRLTYDQLWDRRLVEVDVTLSCVSNEVGGDLVGNARWVGVRLDEVLAEAGIDPDADQVMTHSVDGFTAGFPTSAATDGRDAIIALTMNGEVLPVAHGYPARLVVPGLYGYVSATKWLSRIELTRFDRAQGYWIPRGWAALAPVKTQSRIDVPRSGETVPAGSAVIAGVAWAPDRGVTGVEVQIDDAPWMAATLGPQLGPSAWRQWWLPWPDAASSVGKPGRHRHRLRCRATDGTGVTQTDQRADPAPDGATGWHTIQVELDS